MPLVTRIDPGHEALKRQPIARLGWLSLLPSSLPIWISYTFLFFKPCFGLIFYDSIQHPLLELFLIADNQPLSCFFVIFPEHMKKGSLHRCMCMCARTHKGKSTWSSVVWMSGSSSSMVTLATGHTGYSAAPCVDGGWLELQNTGGHCVYS